MDTFSSYARQFIDNYEKPDVDKITGLSPVISISQKSVSKNLGLLLVQLQRYTIT